MAADPDLLADELTSAMLALLDQWRREVIVVILSTRDPLSGAYRQLLTEVDRLAASYRQQLTTTMQLALPGVAAAGDEAVLEVLRAARVEVPLAYVGVSPDLVRTAAEYDADLIRGLTEDARSRIARDVRLGALGALPADELIDRIGRNLSDRSTFRSIAQRAEMIARTEVNRLYNAAYASQAGEIAERYPERALKVWVHAGSSPGFTRHQRSRSRANHMRVARQTAQAPILMDEDFDLGGGIMAAHPHDFRLPASEVVGCRCRIRLVLQDEQSASPVEPQPLAQHQPQPPTLEEALAHAEAEIRPLPYERVYVFDLDGKEILKKDGDKTSVDFTPDEATQMRGKILTHNHPSGWDFAADDPRRAGNSFSVPDIELLARWQLAEVRAVTPLWTYSMKLPAGSTGEQYWLATLQPVVERELRTAYWAAIRNGSMTIEDANATHYHELWTRVTAELGLEYTREEAP